jgi:hypothetical protein
MQKAFYIVALVVIAWILFSDKKAVASSNLKKASLDTTGSGQSTAKPDDTPYGFTKQIGTYSNMATGETKPITEYFQAQINDDVLWALAKIYGDPNLYMEAAMFAGNHGNTMYVEVYQNAQKWLASGRLKRQ